jgi:hypothetical protein
MPEPRIIFNCRIIVRGDDFWVQSWVSEQENESSEERPGEEYGPILTFDLANQLADDLLNNFAEKSEQIVDALLNRSMKEPT